MFTLRTDTRPLLKSLDRYMEGSRRPREVVLKIQARGILKTAISITPPSDGETTGTAAKKRGEAAVAMDILKIFAPVKKGEDQVTDLDSLHRKYRSSATGRVPHALSPKLRAQKTLLNQYIKAQQLLVGYLVSGWAPSARALGVSMPSWMTRNHAPGDVVIRSTSRGISIRSTNAAPFSGNVKGLERRLQFSVDAQASKIERQIQHHEEQLQKSAGLRR